MPVRTVQRAQVRAAPRSAPINVQLPARGKGYKTYGPRSMQFGSAKTVKSVQRIAQKYNASTGKRLEVGDIAKKGGGKTSRHQTHTRGNDVDLRPPSRAGGPSTWRSKGYDRAATRKLIQEIRRENPRARILFNDPVLIREGLTRPARGHDNHLHASLR